MSDLYSKHLTDFFLSGQSRPIIDATETPPHGSKLLLCCSVVVYSVVVFVYFCA